MRILFWATSISVLSIFQAVANTDSPPTKKEMIQLTNQYQDCVTRFTYDDLMEWPKTKQDFIKLRKKECSKYSLKLSDHMTTYFPTRTKSVLDNIDESVNELIDLRIYKVFNDKILNSFENK